MKHGPPGYDCLHVFPRFRDDGLWGGIKTLYRLEERLELADRLRAALQGAT